MPAAIPIIIAGAASGIGVTAAGAITFSFASAAIGAAFAAAGALISSALAPKPPSAPTFESGTSSTFAAKAQSRTQTLRQSVVARRKPAGTVILGTVLNYYATTGDKAYHHMVLTVCDGPIESFGTVWINDEPVNPDDIDGNGNIVRGRFAGKIRLKFHLGDADQTADSDLVSEVGALNSNFRGRGIAYIYARVEWDRDVLPNGLPGFRVVVNAEVTDPRTSVTGFNDNAAIAWRDYVIDTGLGLGAHSAVAADIDSTAFNAAANVADEIADTNEKAATVEAVDASANTLSLTDDRSPFFTGDRVSVSTTGSLPGGLSGATDYYVIVRSHARASASSPVRIKLATSLANARAGTAIDITSAGSGTHTVTKDGEPRYRATGMIDTSDTPAAILEDILSSMVGTATYTGGKWVLLPGAWRAGTADYDEGDLRGKISGPTRLPKDQRYNRVRGIYASPYNDGEATEYPVVVSSTLLTADNGKTEWDTFDQPFTGAPSQAQRNAGQRLKRYRTGEVQFQSAFSLKAVLANKNRAGDVIRLTNARRGWSQKYFEIRSLTLAVGQDEDGTPVLTCPVNLAATLETDYDWDPATEETDVSPSVRLDGSGIFDVIEPGAPQVSEELYVTRNGAGVKARALLACTATVDAFASEYQFRYKLVGASAYTVRSSVPVPADQIDDIDPGTYEFGVRVVNDFGVTSDWVSKSPVVINGLLGEPSSITGLTMQGVSSLAVLRWDQHPDLDVQIGGRIEFRHSEALTGATWPTSVSIGKAVNGKVTEALLPLKPGTYLARAVDSSGVKGPVASVTTKGSTVLAFANIDTLQAHPDFAGAKTNTVVNEGREPPALQIQSDGLFSEIDLVSEVVLMSAIGGVMSSGTYRFASGFDFGSVTRFRLNATVKALLANVLDTVGSRTTNVSTWESFSGSDAASADVQMYVRETDDDPAGSPTWSDWQRLDVGEYSARGIQAELRLTSDDPAYNVLVEEATLSADEIA